MNPSVYEIYCYRLLFGLFNFSNTRLESAPIISEQLDESPQCEHTWVTDTQEQR